MNPWIATAFGLAMTALGACTVSLVRMAVIGTMTFVFVLVVMVAMAMSAVAVPMSMRVPAGGIGAVFRLKAFVYRVHDQMHGAQHVG